MKKVMVSIILLPIFLAFCGKTMNKKDLQKKAIEAIGLPEPDMLGKENDTPEMADLGKKLFYEKKLSVSDSVSCNSCHTLDDKKGGVDNLAKSTGANGIEGNRNAPTVLNAGYQIAQYWDGRATTLEDQAKSHIINSSEMGMLSESAVVEKLRSLPEYEDLFDKAFPDDGMTFNNVIKAIAAFERTLKTDDRFNDFLRGNENALNEDELEGLQIFLELDCVKCHSGPMMGGQEFKKLGVENPKSVLDLGRYEITKDPVDKSVFKVTPLRNVGITGPYFHDGSIATLRDATIDMVDVQLGKNLHDSDIDLLVKFMKALTDKERL